VTHCSDDKHCIKSGLVEPVKAHVVLDDASGTGTIRRFTDAEQIIQAFDAGEVANAFRALESARRSGRFLAGFFAYELGQVLQGSPAASTGRSRTPLLWFGVFAEPETIARADLSARGRAYATALRHDWDAAAYTARFVRAHAYVGAGDIYQVNLSFRSRFAFAGDPFDLYLTLRDRAQVKHGAYVDTGPMQILSLSPELFFDISRDGIITARPMKGTARRGRDAAADEQTKAWLATSEKDLAENLMIVDLKRNDIGRVARIGSVTVRDLFAVETYPTLHTMVSTVTAQLRRDAGLTEIVHAIFPCGSVTGAPKIRAMEISRELECGPRGSYCGAIGCFAPDGSAQFNVAIRTLTIEGREGTLGIGGAIVQDSNAGGEYAECLLKAQFFEGVRKPIGLIETLRWDGEFVRLDRHLGRMRRSATFLSLPFDLPSARRLLDEAVAGASGPMRVRLTLDEAGHFECETHPLGLVPPQWSFAISPQRVYSGDELLRHKTTWRDTFDAERLRLEGYLGADEALFLNERGELTEGSRTSLFVRRGRRLLTPALSCGLLDGVLRRALLDAGECEEAVLMPCDLATADEVLLGNSLRGFVRGVPVRTLAGGLGSGPA